MPPWLVHPLDPKGPQKIEEEEMEDIADEVEDYMV